MEAKHNHNGEKNPMYGKHHSEETKDKISLKHKGNRHSPKTEFKKGMSPWNKGMIGYNKGKKYIISDELKEKRALNFGNRFIGKKHTIETKLKMSLAGRGKKRSEETKEKLREIRKTKTWDKMNTSIERKIQSYLRELNIEFYTHQYMKIEHGYQCDIFIPSKNLVIECDGDYWHTYPTGTATDHIRTKELIESGFKVLRLWEREIKAMSINQFKEKLNEFI